MATVSLRWKSEVLGVATESWLILPEASEGTPVEDLTPPEGFPVLYLLHGLSDDHTTWARRTSLERHVGPHGLVVVCPQGGRSFYADQQNGYPFFTYISEEIPAVVSRYLRVSTRREDTFVAGFSMGGYGAFLLALRHPERFGAAISLSGVLDVTERFAHVEEAEEAKVNDFARAFGSREDFLDSPYDLIAQVKAADGELPALYAVCGTDDFLLPSNRNFREAAQKAGASLQYEEVPGAHTWGYCEQELPRALDWLARVRGR